MGALFFISNIFTKPRLNAALTLILFGSWIMAFRTFGASEIYSVMGRLGCEFTWGLSLVAIGTGSILAHGYRLRCNREWCMWLEVAAGLLVTAAFAFIAISLTWYNYRLTSTPIYWGMCLFSFFSLLDLVGLSRLVTHGQNSGRHVRHVLSDN